MVTVDSDFDSDSGLPDSGRHTLARSRRTPHHLSRDEFLERITPAQSFLLGTIAVATTAAVVYGALNLMFQLINMLRPWL